MFLFHSTNMKSLKLILKEHYMKSNKITGNINEGYGIYGKHENKFVYFGTTPNLFDDYCMGSIIIYFKTDLLYNRSFYVSTVHSPEPDYLGEWENKEGLEYKRKYSKYTENYNIILKKLYDNSIKRFNKRLFQIFQQVAILNKINITKYIIGIQFSETPDEKFMKYINKNYPDIKTSIKNILFTNLLKNL